MSGLAGGRSCQAVCVSVRGRPVVVGWGSVYMARLEVLAVPGAHADSMRPRDHDHGSAGVVRAAVVAKGRPPS